jgi:hypothetical protein
MRRFALIPMTNASKGLSYVALPKTPFAGIANLRRDIARGNAARHGGRPDR